jgi:hypothetical protein
MAKPKKNQAPPPTAGQAPLIPPTKEEMDRLHIESVLRDQLQTRHDELGALMVKDLKKSDILRTLCATGEAIMANVLQAQGRLRAATGQVDAFVEAKKADFCTRARKSIKLLEGDQVENSIYEEVVEAMKPGLESLQRLVKDLDVPGVKIAIQPMGGGNALFDPEGNVTQAAAPAPAPEPKPKPKPEPTPVVEETYPPKSAAPAPISAREIPTLGMGPVIDVDVVEQAHPLDGMDEAAAEEAVNTLIAKLEEAGVEDGLKRKDWKAAEKAWVATWPEDCETDVTKRMYDRLVLALEQNPVTWTVITDKDLFDHQRKLALAAGE